MAWNNVMQANRLWWSITLISRNICLEISSKYTLEYKIFEKDDSFKEQELNKIQLASSYSTSKVLSYTTIL